MDTSTTADDSVNLSEMSPLSPSPNRVLSWLAKVNPSDPILPAPDQAEDEDATSITCLKPRRDYFVNGIPYTPAHSNSESPAEDQASPTNTSFTDQSIFDEPCTPVNKSFGSAEDDCFSSPATTVGSDHKTEVVEPCKARAWLFETEHVHHVENETANDTDEDLESTAFNGTEVHHASGPFLPTTPDGSTLIWLTSCLQCTLAQLPCSRTLPACSRCVRSGHGSGCLLQRRKLDSERALGDVMGNLAPVLLRVADEDEEVWERKRRVCDELIEAWRAQQDCKNWVFPINDGKMGGFRLGENQRLVRPIHPGEGIGRAVPAMAKLG
ncbi:hypothetical protein K432DRAFT_406806 [Lepidopterella palustris CBS 459.81]|uniref:Zn(2)-C6 fungal-type domain-containing protein n=1 Tax=Lepidopterella palustris CBS 459.81 TaxID=1314670 RepID=A0A8E2E611_9PEZI|nr:hypothetical protein K432DRAFT_406806 [Lepidopterella palustris CBS 459.81]